MVDAACWVVQHVAPIEHCHACTCSALSPLHCSPEALHGAVPLAVHVVTAIGNNIVVRLKLETALTVYKIEWIPHLQRSVVGLGLDLCFSARVLRRAKGVLHVPAEPWIRRRRLPIRRSPLARYLPRSRRDRVRRPLRRHPPWCHDWGARLVARSSRCACVSLAPHSRAQVRLPRGGLSRGGRKRRGAGFVGEGSHASVRSAALRHRQHRAHLAGR